MVPQPTVTMSMATFLAPFGNDQIRPALRLDGYDELQVHRPYVL